MVWRQSICAPPTGSKSITHPTNSSSIGRGMSTLRQPYCICLPGCGPFTGIRTTGGGGLPSSSDFSVFPDISRLHRRLEQTPFLYLRWHNDGLFGPACCRFLDDAAALHPLEETLNARFAGDNRGRCSCAHCHRTFMYIYIYRGLGWALARFGRCQRCRSDAERPLRSGELK